MRRIVAAWERLSVFSRTLLTGSTGLSALCLVLAAWCRQMAGSGDYLRLSGLIAGLWEAAPASLAAGLLAAVLCERVLRE